MKKYIQKEKNSLLVSLLSAFSAALIAVRLQFLKGTVLDFAIDGQLDKTFTFGMILLVAILAEILFSYSFDYFRGRYSVEIEKQLKHDFLNNILSKNPIELRKNKLGDYIAQFTKQIDLISRDYFSTIPLLADIVFKIILVCIALFILDYRMALLTIILLTMPLYIPKLIEKRLQNAQKDQIEAYENQLSKIVEWISGFEIVKGYSICRKIEKQHEKLNEIAKEKSFQLRKLSYISRLITTILSYISHFIILFVSALLVAYGDFTAGDFLISISMIDQLSYPIISLSMYIHEILKSKEIAKDLIEEFKTPACNKIVSLDKPPNLIDFNNLSFSYGDTTVIDKFDLKIRKNEKCLIMGESGAGKSTLMSLMLGHLTPTNGFVSYDTSISTDISDVYDFVTLMDQEAFLFNISLRDNLTLYRDTDDPKIMSVLKALRLDKFANENALDSIIQENGVNLSGGEKKRIALARTLLRDTPIIVLDEPLSNVDSETINAIEDLITETSNKTLIIISHQFNSSKLNFFDHIIDLSS